MRRFAALPISCYAIVFLYACYAAIAVGHWPHYSHPDPKDLPMAALSVIATIAMLIGVISVPLIPVGYAGFRLVAHVKHRPVPAHARWIGLYAVGAILWILDVVAINRGLPWASLSEWLID